MSQKTLSEIIKTQVAILDELEFIASGRELTLDEAREIQEAADTATKNFKQIKLLTQETISSRYYKNIFDQYRHKNKQSGRITYAPDGEPGVMIEANIAKKVEWDTDKLIGVFGQLDYDIAAKYINVSMKLSEKQYGEVMDGSDINESLQNEINAARTVTLGQPTIKVVKIDA